MKSSRRREHFAFFLHQTPFKYECTRSLKSLKLTYVSKLTHTSLCRNWVLRRRFTDKDYVGKILGYHCSVLKSLLRWNSAISPHVESKERIERVSFIWLRVAAERLLSKTMQIIKAHLLREKEEVIYLIGLISRGVLLSFEGFSADVEKDHTWWLPERDIYSAFSDINLRVIWTHFLALFGWFSRGTNKWFDVSYPNISLVGNSREMRRCCWFHRLLLPVL